MSETVIQNWKPIVEQWEESGLSKAEFCRRQKLSIGQFGYHSIKYKAFSRNRCKNSSTKRVQSGQGAFAEVICQPSNQHSASLILRLDFGGSIELSSGFDDELLKSVLEATKAL